MDKTDAMRAIKQARAEARRAAAPAPRAAPPAVTPGAPRVRPEDVDGPAGLGLAPQALCGHTAISGRRCTRPQGHPEKNHRYAA